MTEPEIGGQIGGTTVDTSVTQPTPPAEEIVGVTVTVPDDVTILPAEPIAADEPAGTDVEVLVVEYATVLITPAEGQPLEGLARMLLDLAEHPHQVEWRPRQGAFEVPAALAQAYAQAVIPAPEDAKKKPATRKGTRSTTKAKKEAGTSG